MEMQGNAVMDKGFTPNISSMKPIHIEELFGHVILVEGYALATYVGCHALVTLRDTPDKTVAVLTTEERLQSPLEIALETGNLIAFWGQKLSNPPNPRGGTWAVEVYSINGVILYNMH